MLITVSSMVSVVVMILLLDWKPRWVLIIWTNSVDMSTLDCSRVLPLMVPRPATPAGPDLGSPESRVWLNRLLPSRRRPWVQLKSYRVICHRGRVTPLDYTPYSTPSASTLQLDKSP